MTSQSAVVAQLNPKHHPHYPISSISASPDGRHAVIAGKESLRFVCISSSGLDEVASVHVAQHFQVPRSLGGAANDIARGALGNTNNNLMEAFHAPSAPPITINNTITSVAWSPPQRVENKDIEGDVSTSTHGSGGLLNQSNSFDSVGFLNQSDTNSYPGISGLGNQDSYIASAGSNGVVVLWRSSDLFIPSSVTVLNTSTNPYRYSNAYFDSPSSLGKRIDSTLAAAKPEAILAEHSKAVNQLAWHPNLSGHLLTASQDSTVNLWRRKVTTTTIEEKDPPPNIVSWLAGLGHAPPTNREKRIQSFSWHCVAKIRRSNGAVRDIKWSPFNDDIFAMVTNNGSLLVFNTRVLSSPIVKITAHTKEATTLDWHPSRQYIVATGGTDKRVRVWDLEAELSLNVNDEDCEDNLKVNSRSHTDRNQPPHSPMAIDPLSRSYHGGSDRPHAFQSGQLKRSLSFIPPSIRQQKHKMHELSISAAVQTLKWRPPKPPNKDWTKAKQCKSINHHDAMLGVATAPTTGVGGGHGQVALWSYHRPYMPLSIVEGHTEGAVSMFLWIDTPDIQENNATGHDTMTTKLKGTYQHVLSVGRDGRCLLQSLARGERPISTVPPSCFALANLSPFQSGYGSLQLISVHQKVPSGDNNDYELCGLRRDLVTSMSRGVFRETLPPDDVFLHNTYEWRPQSGGEKPDLPDSLTFMTTDRGNLDELPDLILQDKGEVAIAPEVIHISRFADRYQLHKDSNFSTKAKICRHNGNVAEQLHCRALSRMWNMLASILDGSTSEDILDSSSQQSFPSDPFTFLLSRTLKALLLERAEASDVQTLVYLCEIFEVTPRQKSTSQPQTIRTNVPGLDISLVRQWYLSYIDLLQQMCLFTHATELIKYSNDPVIGKLNMQSTTFHESCPTCFKPILRGKEESCKSCRQKIGMCCLCHQNVKGLYAWCSGCGHGGHMECLLEWFKNNSSCPTGCGHKCTIFQQARASSFPRTCSSISIGI